MSGISKASGLWQLMVTNISYNPSDTEALGELWGRAAQEGLVIGLSGDLGAGKTQLVKGLARGLGIPARTHSPTFTIVNIYTGGRLTLFHIDLYRLDTPAQMIEAGLEEYLDPAGVTVVEWAEKWFGRMPKFPKHYRSVTIDAVDESGRRISYEDIGA